MAEKKTKFCSDCIHYDVCYKIEHYGRDLEGISACEQFISKDVAPVNRGHWIRPYDASDKSYRWKCSNCGNIANYVHKCGKYDSKIIKCGLHYCPNCGAKLDGERKEILCEE